MTRERRHQLRHIALLECASILDSALNADIGVFDKGNDEDERQFIEDTMEQVMLDLYAKARRYERLHAKTRRRARSA